MIGSGEGLKHHSFAVAPPQKQLIVVRHLLFEHSHTATSCDEPCLNHPRLKYLWCRGGSRHVRVHIHEQGEDIACSEIFKVYDLEPIHDVSTEPDM